MKNGREEKVEHTTSGVMLPLWWWQTLACNTSDTFGRSCMDSPKDASKHRKPLNKKHLQLIIFLFHPSCKKKKTKTKKQTSQENEFVATTLSCFPLIVWTFWCSASTRLSAERDKTNSLCKIANATNVDRAQTHSTQRACQGGRWWCGSYLSESHIMEARSNWFVKHEVRFYKFNELGLREVTQGLTQVVNN